MKTIIVSKDLGRKELKLFGQWINENYTNIIVSVGKHTRTNGQKYLDEYNSEKDV